MTARPRIPTPLSELELTLLENQPAGPTGLSLPPGFVLPDYGRSIANLPATIASLFGVTLPGALPPLQEAGLGALSEDVERVIWIVMDAVGWFHFRELLEDNTLFFSRLAQSGVLIPITSVFPSTTTTALTSLWTGAAPAQHGILGHNLYLPSLDMIVDTLGFSPAGEVRDESLIVRGMTPESLVPVPGLAEILSSHGVTTRVLNHQQFVSSGLSRLLYRGASVSGFLSPADMCILLSQTIHNRADEHLLLAVYWGSIDTISHVRGPGGPSWTAEMRMFDFCLEQIFLKELKPEDRRGTLVLFTADHGQVAATPGCEIKLGDHPELKSCQRMALSGGPRAPYLRLKPQRRSQVSEYVGSHWDHEFTWTEPQAALDAGLFGPGTPAVDVTDVVGDLILLGKENYVLTQFDRDRDLMGLHGGLSRWEMLVPLLAVRFD